MSDHLRSVEQVVLNDTGSLPSRLASVDEPLVISGATKTWPAMSALKLNELKKVFGNATIPVRKSDDEFKEFFGSRDEQIGPRPMMKLATYIDTILRSSNDYARPPYAGNISVLGDPAVAHRLGQVVSSCHFPRWRSQHAKDEYRLWIAARGQRSTIHNDPYDNFNAQIVGNKYFLIFAPNQHKFLYPAFFHPGLWVSPIDPRNPDFEKFPNFRDIGGYEHELKEGDILYIPRFWWHYAEARTECVNVNRWVFAEAGDSVWWHQQPAARAVIRYKELSALVRSQFDSWPSELQEIRRVNFEKLKAELDQFDEQQK